MKLADFTALSPLIALALTPIAVMIAIAIRRSYAVAVALTLAGLAASFASLWSAASQIPRRETPLLVIDGYALLYIALIVIATFVVALLSYGYFEKRSGNREEYFVLLSTAALGSAVLAASAHFVSFFLGLEILSVALYGLIAYPHTLKRPVEAGLKYLVLAAASAAFLLFGMALIYGATGALSFAGIARALEQADPAYLLPGSALILTGVGFKLAVAPFHLWTPDVYEGAPAPATAFIATASKGGMVSLLLRYSAGTGAGGIGPVMTVVAITAIASMVAGNLLALQQTNVKRILAYSSIAHLGYVLVAFLAGGTSGAAAATFYIAAYIVTILGAFGVVTVLSGADGEAEDLDDYRGLFWRRPLLAAVFTAMLLSLAGLPLTAGFLGKFYVVAAGAATEHWALILVLVVTSAIGLYYYLRVVVALYAQPLDTPAPLPCPGVGIRLTLVALLALLLWLGIYPGPILDLVRAAVSSLL